MAFTCKILNQIEVEQYVRLDLHCWGLASIRVVKQYVRLDSPCAF